MQQCIYIYWDSRGIMRQPLGLKSVKGRAKRPERARGDHPAIIQRPSAVPRRLAEHRCVKACCEIETHVSESEHILLGGVILTTLRCRPWGPALGRFERRPRTCGKADAQRGQVGNRVSRTLTGPWVLQGAVAFTPCNADGIISVRSATD